MLSRGDDSAPPPPRGERDRLVGRASSIPRSRGSIREMIAEWMVDFAAHAVPGVILGLYALRFYSVHAPSNGETSWPTIPAVSMVVGTRGFPRRKHGVAAKMGHGVAAMGRGDGSRRWDKMMGRGDGLG